ncbi:fatty acid desaturase family protein [Kitasatospora sp. NPDC088346]|uniref:fatty acid desaturase family protein n=1 Tax=Kitasatospora sp. NPDC088346 TaxID=3364073 RepID=UPI003802CCC6
MTSPHGPAGGDPAPPSADPYRPYKKGYTAPAQLREAIKAAHRTSLWRTTACAAIDHLVAIGLAVGAARAWTALPPAIAAPVTVVALAGIARQQRAVENLVHEGSHYNWSRHHRRANDLLAYVLAALPVGQRLRSYRDSHLRHHSRFGALDDPDRRRYEELRIEDITRGTLPHFARELVVRLPRYQYGWLKELRSDATALLGPSVWSVCVVTVPTCLVAGTRTGITAGVVWLTALLLVLPALRFVSEADEHVYTDSTTVFDATVTNTGRLQRLLFHPHADGYHTVHHMWPGIPHHRLARVHRRLMAEDPAFAARIRTRTAVLAPASAARPGRAA